MSVAAAATFANRAQEYQAISAESSSKTCSPAAAGSLLTA
ncbi:hypothetical protein [Mycobacterium lepromatosis]